MTMIFTEKIDLLWEGVLIATDITAKKWELTLYFGANSNLLEIQTPITQIFQSVLPEKHLALKSA